MGDELRKSDALDHSELIKAIRNEQVRLRGIQPLLSRPNASVKTMPTGGASNHEASGTRKIDETRGPSATIAETSARSTSAILTPAASSSLDGQVREKAADDPPRSKLRAFKLSRRGPSPNSRTGRAR